jgi:hypothetical protein
VIAYDNQVALILIDQLIDYQIIPQSIGSAGIGKNLAENRPFRRDTDGSERQES